MIKIFTNSLGDEELKAVEETFKSQWIGLGPKTKEFEEALKKRIGANNCLMVNCCSAANLIALKALGIGPGDEVIVSTINFVASASTVLEVGATPVFADVDSVYFNILPSEIKRLRNAKTKAVILLHYGGHPCDMDKLYEECNGLFIIEDSANSIVSKYKGKHCGTLGDAGFFSFDAMKILSTGDGGALVLKSEEAADRAFAFRYLGFDLKESTGVDRLKVKKNRWWEFELLTISNRYLMNDITASIGLVQLKKLDSFIQRRKEIWNIYQKELVGISSLILPPEPLDGSESSYYLYWLRITSGKRDELAMYLVDNGVYCTFRYYPLHLVKLYGSKNTLENAEDISETALNIPLTQNLTDTEIEKIIYHVKKFFS
ncbi:MAG: hypothetical protein A2440_04745 [Stygiobacter sp. RIFOXYC2_FULL_38_25]|nr:MAG: hypothetical protein A2299_11840 [Stygiobacter sp. RIFOXYB2_FULL_37_11]OGV10839.1 MAG: hypothetical protein A2237_01600 [Stygiobacter sp. RIFOXYA2_FULL_38_8]OGV16335.1 MAG: hypothetical protein A2440_04745 [Stygiobacter sp. RIFOXYC2_FULL_38_25]OGV81573.1 MAG: hypothetical protein A2X65_15090 [Stygiobacter sp. GWF2_38_21]